MSMIERIGRGAGGVAARGTWFARGAWLLAVGEALISVKDHVTDRLSENDRRRLVEIIRTSKGRPGNLSARERRELQALFSKIEPAELAKSVARAGVSGRRGRGKR